MRRVCDVMISYSTNVVFSVITNSNGNTMLI
jgi:hypothetical protein